VAIGNFDGVHLGHAAVLHAATALAHHRGGEVHALTFEPHPCLVLEKEKEPFLLTPLDVKTRLLRAAGADAVLVAPFTKTFAGLSPDSFVEEILLASYAPEHVVIGHDFAFGARRSGTLKALQEALLPHGIGVSEVPPWRDQSGEVISSTRVRGALRRGDPLLARQLLGRPFALEGEVLHGDKRGRTIGFPTANIDMGPYVRPLYGVYAGRARKVGEETAFPALVNIGIRPTIGGARELLEAHLIGFEREIYGETWQIELWGFIRPEQKFASLDDLRAQIVEDAAAAHRFADF
jgi:riboflavin kinase/FMN adenylyltransferase